MQDVMRRRQVVRAPAIGSWLQVKKGRRRRWLIGSGWAGEVAVNVVLTPSFSPTGGGEAGGEDDPATLAAEKSREKAPASSWLGRTITRTEPIQCRRAELTA